MTGSLASVSQRLAFFAHSLDFNELPASVVETAKDRLLDCLATAIPAHGLPVPTVSMALVESEGGNATVIGESGKFGIADAAFINATLINGRTQDDVLYKSHPGAVVIPPVLAIGESLNASGREVLTAIVIGYEIVSRAYLGGPSMLPRFRATGVAGIIGAAAAAARMYGLSTEQTRDALGCAAVFAGGFGAGFLTGTMDVKLNVGMAARNGVSAAMLARAGATASPFALEGEAGYYEAVANTAHDAEHATAGLGSNFLIEETVYKEFPICNFVQTPVALAQEIATSAQFDRGTIERVKVTVSTATFTNPGFTNTAPFGSALDARISAKFCVAAALLGRPIDNYAFYYQFDDPEVLSLAARIELVNDRNRTETVDMEVISAGRSYRAAQAEGATMMPNRDKINAKFLRLASPCLGDRAMEVMRLVHSLDDLDNIARLTQELGRRTGEASTTHIESR